MENQVSHTVQNTHTNKYASLSTTRFIRTNTYFLPSPLAKIYILNLKMFSYGKAENENLKRNLEDQLDRLVEQLADLEDCRDELDVAEYQETKDDTMEQLKELNVSLTKLVNGDISLISELGAMQLATQAAISQAFKTPEVIRLFGKKEPMQLRERLSAIEQEVKLNKLSIEAKDRQKAEILTALRQLGEQLTASELQFLEKHNDISNIFKDVEFIEVTDNE